MCIHRSPKTEAPGLLAATSDYRVSGRDRGPGAIGYGSFQSNLTNQGHNFIENFCGGQYFGQSRSLITSQLEDQGLSIDIAIKHLGLWAHGLSVYPLV